MSRQIIARSKLLFNLFGYSVIAIVLAVVMVMANQTSKVSAAAPVPDFGGDCDATYMICPYFVIEGGDVSSGNGITLNGVCYGGGPTLETWTTNNSSGQGYYGGADQGAALINGDIDSGVASDLDASQPIGSPSYTYPNAGIGPDYLVFANSRVSPIVQYPKNNAISRYGGYFGFASNSNTFTRGVPCAPDYYNQTLTSSDITPLPNVINNTVDLSTVQGGDYSYTGVLIINDNGHNITSATTTGKPINIAVNGNVFIQSNVNYSYTNPATIPQLNIYAAGPGADATSQTYGNIYVQNDVQDIHGFYVAEGNSNNSFELGQYFNGDGNTWATVFQNGLFTTCATINPASHAITVIDDKNQCATPLSFYGAVDANIAYLSRSFGSLGDINTGHGSGTDASHAAETLTYSPELWVPNANSNNCPTFNANPACIGSGYAAEVSLPPVL